MKSFLVAMAAHHVGMAKLHSALANCHKNAGEDDMCDHHEKIGQSYMALGESCIEYAKSLPEPEAAKADAPTLNDMEYFLKVEG